nr:MAG TPA: hypothetical protein [Caudoviricetes sp.]
MQPYLTTSLNFNIPLSIPLDGNTLLIYSVYVVSYRVYPSSPPNKKRTF